MDDDARQDLQALRAEARRSNISLAELLRRIVGQHLHGRSPAPTPPASAYLKFVGIGSSRKTDIAEPHDGYIGQALRKEHAR